MRVVHIQKNLQIASAVPTHDIIDAGRYGEETGAAVVLHSMEREQIGDWLAREGVKYSTIEEVLADLRTAESVEVQLPLRAGPRIVRAWFDTVVNPLVQSLEAELALLGQRNWTFTWRPPRLDLVRPLRDYLSYEASPNLDQLLRSSDESLEAGVGRHDDLVERLLRAVTSTHSHLAKDQAFKSACSSLLVTERLEELRITSPDEVFGAYPPTERFELLAQYVVNNTALLSPHYSTSKFWNRHRATLMTGLTIIPEVHSHYSSALRLGDELNSASRNLLAQIRDLRDQLSLQYDVPLVLSSR